MTVVDELLRGKNIRRMLEVAGREPALPRSPSSGEPTGHEPMLPDNFVNEWHRRRDEGRRFVELIDAELDRLGVLLDRGGQEGISCELNDGDPVGSARLFDGDRSYFGTAESVYHALREVMPEDVEGPEGDPHGFNAAISALTDFEGTDPDDEAWDDCRKQTGHTTALGRFTVIALITNGGVKYGYVPTDPQRMGRRSPVDYSSRFDSVPDALDDAERRESGL